MPLARPHESHETLLIAPIGKTPIKSEDCLLNAKPKLSGQNQATGKPTSNYKRLWPQSRVGMVTPTSLWPQSRVGVATPTSPVAPKSSGSGHSHFAVAPKTNGSGHSHFACGPNRRFQSSVPVVGPSHRSQSSVPGGPSCKGQRPPDGKEPSRRQKHNFSRNRWCIREWSFCLIKVQKAYTPALVPIPGVYANWSFYLHKTYTPALGETPGNQVFSLGDTAHDGCPREAR